MKKLRIQLYDAAIESGAGGVANMDTGGFIGVFAARRAVMAYSGQTVAFTIGRTITGATSGATGKLVSGGTGAAGNLTLISVSGQFTLGEALSDGLTGNGNVNGGMVFSTLSAPVKELLFNKLGVAIANPAPLLNGGATVYINNLVDLVDLYILAPSGQFITMKQVSSDGIADVICDRTNRQPVYVIPFSKVDYAAATETSTGYVLKTDGNLSVGVDAAIQVNTLEAAKTISVGTLSTEGGGNATGFINAISLAAATTVNAQSQATITRGALLGAGTLDKGYAVTLQVARTISLTLSAATTVADGYIILPVVLGLS